MRILLGLVAVAVIMISATVSVAEEESYPTNLAMLTEAATAAVNEMLLDFNAPPGSSILLEADNAHEARWFVQNLILKQLTARDYTVYLKPGDEVSGTDFPPDAATAARRAQLDQEAADDSTTVEPEMVAPPAPKPDIPVTDYVLRFRVAECGVTYPKAYRKSPLGSKTVQRLALVSLFGTMVHGSREDVVWVGQGDAERLDHVPASKLPLLEGKTFPFTKPELESRGLGAYVEPALVLLIVGGLVYLFYTNQ